MRSTNTWPEVLLADALEQAGLPEPERHVRRLPGTPDIVFAEGRLVVFVHGCFWHRHLHCRRARTPETNRLTWIRRFSATVQHDQQVRLSLHQQGWATFIAWECDILGNPDRVATAVGDLLRRRAGRRVVTSIM